MLEVCSPGKALYTYTAMWKDWSPYFHLRSSPYNFLLPVYIYNFFSIHSHFTDRTFRKERVQNLFFRLRKGGRIKSAALERVVALLYLMGVWERIRRPSPTPLPFLLHVLRLVSLISQSLLSFDNRHETRTALEARCRKLNFQLQHDLIIAMPMIYRGYLARAQPGTELFYILHASGAHRVDRFLLATPLYLYLYPCYPYYRCEWYLLS